jgi:hypothetical protein
MGRGRGLINGEELVAISILGTITAQQHRNTNNTNTNTNNNNATTKSQ